jgi:TolB-like protein/Tfp pilus assembly protein PilF
MGDLFKLQQRECIAKTQTGSEETGGLDASRETPPSQAAQDALEKILVDPTFRASQRLKDLLRYLVEETIAGRGEELKEYTIGLEVFKKPESFDPRLDNIVRTDARRLRSRLAEYYAEGGREDSIRIEFVKGRYSPVFRSTAMPQGVEERPEAEGEGIESEPVNPTPPEPGEPIPPAEPKKIRTRPALNWKIAAVLIAVLSFAGVVIIWLNGRNAPTYSQTPSVLVIPFENRSDDKEDEFFSDGLTDELIDALARLPGLNVVARGSAFALKGKEIDVRQVGRQFNASSILGGSVRRNGNRLRITAQLDDAATGYNLWSQSYDRDSKDIIAIQRNISEAIAKALGIELKGNGVPKDEGRIAVNPEAYQEYLRGRYFYNKTGLNDRQTALDHFKLAIAKDPNYAPAYAGIAHASAWVLDSWDATTAREIIPVIRTTALKALELDSSLGEAHLDLALVAEFEYDWPLAERQLKLALELAPSSAFVRHRYSRYLLRTGQTDAALAQERLALQLDPVSPLIAATLGNVYRHMGRFDEAIAALKDAQALNPNSSMVHWALGATYLHKGMHDQGLAEMLKTGPPADHMTNPAIAYAYAVSGNEAKARDILSEILEGSRGVPRAFDLSRIYTGLGDKDRAFEWLGKTIEDGDPRLFLKTDPNFDPLRSDSRFDDLLRKMRLD